MSALLQQTGGQIRFCGIGGNAMQSEGLKSLFSIEELAIMGPAAFIAAIPRGYRLAKKLVKYFNEEDIDALIIVDSPEFNHPVARWLRARNEDLPIFNLVAPTVWAWRASRARKMKPYINEVLAVLPFEPQVFAELGGPPCTFVGHPVIDRATHFDMSGDVFRKKYSIGDKQTILVVLPGSRHGEIRRHMAIFSDTVERFSNVADDATIVMPIIPHMKDEVLSQLKQLKLNVLLIEEEEDKWGAFRAADLALAASGTVTLELMATHTPMVVAYRLDRIASFLKWLVNVHSVVLPNLIMGENLVPEFIDKECTSTALVSELTRLYQSKEIRDKQCDYLKQAAIKMGSTNQQKTADRAALAIIKRLNLEHS